PAFSPAVLAVEPADVESRHGLALLQARTGDLEGAIAALTALAKGRIAAEDAARVEREIARLGELRKLRDAFLENLRQAGTKWSAEVQGKKIVASIAKVEDGSVRLAPNRQGIEKFPLSALDPMEYAKQAMKKEQQGDAAPWARFYAYVLPEDSKWAELLKNDWDEARSLREDAKSFYPARIRAGRAAYAFEELAKTKLPSSRGEGEAACTRLRGILGEFRALPLVQRKMGDLKRYARAAVEA